MGKIYEFKLSYGLVKKYVLFCFRRFYGEFIIKGKENLPTDNSALIFAPNHLNALMDALAVSSLLPPRKAAIFLARADLFSNKTVAKLMEFAKIMPAFRMRDGYENLEKNNRVFFKAIDVLRFGHSICMMPEGGQGEERKIRPLVKGIFRLALDAQQEFGTNRKVKIVPVGIDLGDIAKCGKHMIIHVGEPIDVQSYMESYEINPAAAMNDMREILRQRLSDLTIDLATSENYETFETITEIMAHEYVDDVTDKSVNTTFEQFRLRQEAAKKLVQIEQEKPEFMSELNRLSNNYNKLLHQLRFKSSIFSNLKSDETSSWRFIRLFLTLPVFLFGFITNFLPTFVPVWIRKAITVDYKGFHSSIQFGLGVFLFPIFYVLQAVLFQLIVGVSWWAVLLFFALQYFTRKFALDWYSDLIRYIHKIRFNNLLEAKFEISSPLYHLISIRNRIVWRLTNKNRENQ